jgi:hypothetical protein
VPWRLILALLFMTAPIGPASAEVQHAATTPILQSDLLWNLIGLLGLIGLIGLLPQHEEDSYHPSAME